MRGGVWVWFNGENDSDGPKDSELLLDGNLDLNGADKGRSALDGGIHGTGFALKLRGEVPVLVAVKVVGPVHGAVVAPGADGVG